MPIPFDPAHGVPGPIPFNESHRFTAGGGETPDSAINEMPPDEDFPSRFLLQLATTGPEQITDEIRRAGFEAVNQDEGVKVRSNKDKRWYHFDPTGIPRTFGEAVRDVGDVTSESLTTAGQIGGGLAALLGSGGNPLAGIAGGGLGAGATDLLRTQVLGRALGYKPNTRESVKSAMISGGVGAASELGGLGFRPLKALPSREEAILAGQEAPTMTARIGNWVSKPGSAALRTAGIALRVPAAIERGLTGFLTGAPSPRAGTFNFLRRYAPANLAYATMAGGFLPAAEIQFGIHGAAAAGQALRSLGAGELLQLIGNRIVLASRGGSTMPFTIRRRIFDVARYFERGNMNAGKIALSVALRTPGVREWIEQNIGPVDDAATIRNKTDGTVWQIKPEALQKYLDSGKWERVDG